MVVSYVLGNFTKEEFDGPVELKNCRVPPGSIAVFRRKDAASDRLTECLTAAAPWIDEINGRTGKCRCKHTAADQNPNE